MERFHQLVNPFVESALSAMGRKQTLASSEVPGRVRVPLEQASAAAPDTGWTVSQPFACDANELSQKRRR